MNKAGTVCECVDVCSVDRRQACPSAELSHAELIRLIGEIDGIDLEGREGRLFVILRIGGKNIELIADSSDSPSHHITREGIRAVLSQTNTCKTTP
jgi:hypothetical protein